MSLSKSIQDNIKESEYSEIYGEEVDYLDMRKLITALRAVCDKAEADGFNHVDAFKTAINDLSDVNGYLEDFYEYKG